MTASGDAHSALADMLEAAFAGPVSYGTGSTVEVEVLKDEGRFIELPTGASVVIPRGDASNTGAEFGAGQQVYELTLSIPVEVHCQDADQSEVELIREAIADTIVTAVQANQTLNGTADDVDVLELTTHESGQEGTANLATAIVGLIVTIYSNSPI